MNNNMRQLINIPIYYHVDDDNKIVVDYEQMSEYYKTEIEILKLDVKYENNKT